MIKGRDFLFSAVLMLMLVALIAFGFLAVLRKLDLTPAAVIITFLSTNSALLIGYAWGSSRGSKEKDEVIAKQNEDKL